MINFHIIFRTTSSTTAHERQEEERWWRRNVEMPPHGMRLYYFTNHSLHCEP